MEILVCVKRVPDTAENEIEVNRDGTDIERDDLVCSVNEWDNYAVEEAIQIRDKVGGSITIVTVGDKDDEEVVRREMAMGADNGLLLSDDAFNGSDGKGIAAALKAAVEKGSYDLILTGAQADDGAGQVGGMLAAMLDWPYASLVNLLEVIDDKKIKVGREIAADDLGVAKDTVGESGARIKRLDYFVPDPGEGAEILEGSTDEIIDKLVELLKAKGGIK